MPSSSLQQKDASQQEGQSALSKAIFDGIFLRKKWGKSRFLWKSPRTCQYPLVMTNIAIENGPVEIVSFPIKNGGSFHSFLYVYQRVHGGRYHGW